MGKREQVIMIALSSVLLLFLFTRVYLPLLKDNAKQRREYNKIKLELREIEKLISSDLSSLESKINMAMADIEQKIPLKGKIELIEHLTRVPEGSDIIFSGINQRNSIEGQGFQAYPVDVNIRTPFYDLIKYLANIETAPLMIGVDSLNIRKTSPQSSTLDVMIGLFGFRITKTFPSLEEYSGDNLQSFNKAALERLIKPVERIESKNAVTRLRDYDPFMAAYGFGKDGVYPERETLKTETLQLRGILRIGGEKVALINDRLVREGEVIAEMKVREIQEYKVIMKKLNKEYILKMGVEDELLKQ